MLTQYSNGMSGTLLWTNPSDTTLTSNAYITLSDEIDKYDFLGFYTADNNYWSIQKPLFDKEKNLYSYMIGKYDNTLGWFTLVMHRYTGDTNRLYINQVRQLSNGTILPIGYTYFKYIYGFKSKVSI